MIAAFVEASGTKLVELSLNSTKVVWYLSLTFIFLVLYMFCGCDFCDFLGMNDTVYGLINYLSLKMTLPTKP